MAKKKPDYSDKPTLILEYASGEGRIYGIVAEGMELPSDVRIILRDYSHGEPDEFDQGYEDEELSQ